MAEDTQDNDNEIKQVEKQLQLMRLQLNQGIIDIKQRENELISHEQKMKQDELQMLQLETQLLNKSDEFDKKIQDNTNVNYNEEKIDHQNNNTLIIQCHKCLREIQPNINETIYINDKDIKVLCNKCFSDINPTENTNEWTNYIWNKNEILDKKFNNRFNFIIQCSIANYGIGPTLDKISESLEVQSKLQQTQNLKYLYIDRILTIGLNDVINNDKSDNIIPNMPDINDIAHVLNNINQKNDHDKSEMDDETTEINDDAFIIGLGV